MKTMCMLAIGAIVCACAGAVWALDVPVANASFESPVVEGEVLTVPDSWTWFNDGSMTEGVPNYEIYLRNGTGAPDGNQITELHVMNSATAYLYQVLSTKAQTGSTYTVNAQLYWAYRGGYMKLEAQDPTNLGWSELGSVAVGYPIGQGEPEGTWFQSSFTTGPVPAAQHGWNMRVLFQPGAYYNAWMKVDNVTIVAVPTLVAVQGTVVPQGYTGDNSTVGVRFEFRSLTGGYNSTQSTFLYPDGIFELYVPEGTYDIAVKSYAHLQKVLRNKPVSGGLADLGTINLVPGDIDGDNETTSTDLSILLLNLDIQGDGL